MGKDSGLEKQGRAPRLAEEFFLRLQAARRRQVNPGPQSVEATSTFRNRSARLKPQAHQLRLRRKCRPARDALCPARPTQQNFCALREREEPMPPRRSSLPLDRSFLPNEDSIAQFEEQSHDGRKESSHDDQRGENFSVFGPALRPTKIPTETGFYPDGLCDYEGQKRSAETHKQADKDVRNRCWNSDSKDEIATPGAESASHVKVGCSSVGNAGCSQHCHRKPHGERN